MDIYNWISFIQMSDIHFRSFSGDPYDIDKNLQLAMLGDLDSEEFKKIIDVKGILVCGDLAFSGQQEELNIAKDFLERVATKCTLSLKDIFCVAGNHDVDQNVIKGSYIINVLQSELVKIDKMNPENVDNILRKIQNDRYVQGLMYAPIENYNAFASGLLCNYTVDEPNWQSDFLMNGQYRLRLWGMNSILVSNHNDNLNDNECKMLISNMQVPRPEEKIIYMTLCHHPTQCWNNQQLIPIMDERAKLQLYGHKHIQSIDANSKRIIINSGALQPERGNEWIPLYNWISVAIWKDELVVRVYPRVYDNKTGKFHRDIDSCDAGRDYKELKLSLRSEIEIEHCEEKDHNIRKITSSAKEIAYRYSVLSQSDLKAIERRFPDVKCYKNELDKLLAQLKEKNMEEAFLDVLRTL